MLEFNTASDIHEASECDDMNCRKCNGYNSDVHSGNEVVNLISCNYIQYGDYDNSCAVGRANVKYLKENNLIEKLETGGYGGIKAWLLDTEENRELLNSLFNYPCFDDEMVSELESEMEMEYIKVCASDLHKLLSEDMQQAIEELSIDEIDQDCYFKACEASNTYFEVESGGNGYVDFKRIAKDYAIALCDKFPAIKSLCAIYETVNNILTFPIDFYENAEDMLQHKQATNGNYSQDEIKDIISYCVELEKLINALKP